MRSSKIALVLLAAFAAGGCQSIPSSAVRSLIQEEGKKIDQAQANSDDVIGDTKDRVRNIKSAVSDLDSATEEVCRIQAVESLIFSANTHVGPKTGVDAEATAYMIGQIFLADAAGLDVSVKKQFADDQQSLTDAAADFQESWKRIKTLHTKIDEFSKKSSFASVDPDLLSAVVAEIPGTRERLDKVLENGKKVNDTLEKASAFSGTIAGSTAGARSTLGDLLDLLGRVK